MLNAYVVALAAEEHINENVPNHWLVGGVTLAFLMALLLGLIFFGAGREHS
ncbi:hypothetical protein KM427_17830 [Nocardioides sp. LMS-CY]|uniref:Uncharacterized protein n=1 Tax=Nocardioides soli TaxID=1036020 RepID=A0A7W4VXQ2_9ACTN|nr:MULTISPECIES: hypothetical protein [Nocardioides]MBB3043688.1 hypothetical protein [Nocardioides soli]QWF20811.1 hypothetical protein KM427_17830 [Nocardioides sp. LMS-CY]